MVIVTMEGTVIYHDHARETVCLGKEADVVVEIEIAGIFKEEGNLTDSEIEEIVTIIEVVHFLEDREMGTKTILHKKVLLQIIMQMVLLMVVVMRLL